MLKVSGLNQSDNERAYTRSFKNNNNDNNNNNNHNTRRDCVKDMKCSEVIKECEKFRDECTMM